MAAAKQGPMKTEVSRTVRFAPTVNFVNENDKAQTPKSTAKNLVILLVEDNPVCRFSHAYLHKTPYLLIAD
jgi:hypothetical protein